MSGNKEGLILKPISGALFWGLFLNLLSSSGGHEQGPYLKEGSVLKLISGGQFWGLFPNREEPRQ